MADVSHAPAGSPPIRTFSTGATRDTAQGKLDYDGFFSPLVLKRRARYMHEHRVQADGTLRDSDNWQRGIPEEEYRKSTLRHLFEDWWPGARGWPITVDIEDAACAILFNLEGWLHERLKRKLTL